MRGVFSVVVATAALPWTASSLHYVLPKELLALADSCFYPANFTLHNFMAFTPAAGNANSLSVNFRFVDNGTGIDCPCSLNSSSKATNEGNGLLPRYACDDPLVQFIWQPDVNRTTMIEVACPGKKTGITFEASGSVVPTLDCKTTDCDSAAGDGSCCSAASALQGNYTSLQPSPPAAAPAAAGA